MRVTDESLIEAMRIPRGYRMAAWALALRAHRGHPTFSVSKNPMDRTYGFTCSCTGVEETQVISISSLREALPETRQNVERLFAHFAIKGMKKSRRAEKVAGIKAKALLFKHLTKPQKWELRASKTLTVQAQDQRTYRITQGSHDVSTALLNSEGEPVYSFCLIPEKVVIPAQDLVLAHKVLLENDVKTFLRTSHVKDLRTKETFLSGAFLLGETERNPVTPESSENDNLEALRGTIGRQDTEEPEAWVRAQIEGVHDANAT